MGNISKWEHLGNISKQKYCYSENFIHHLINQLYICIVFLELEVLDLSESGLVQIPNGAFKQLNKLIELTISGNQLTNLYSDTFAGLEKLRVCNST